MSSSFWYSGGVVAHSPPWLAYWKSERQQSDLQLILWHCGFLMPHWRWQHGISWAQHTHTLIISACMHVHIHTHTATSLSRVSTEEVTPLSLPFPLVFWWVFQHSLTPLLPSSSWLASPSCLSLLPNLTHLSSHPGLAPDTATGEVLTHHC